MHRVACLTRPVPHADDAPTARIVLGIFVSVTCVENAPTSTAVANDRYQHEVLHVRPVRVTQRDIRNSASIGQIYTLNCVIYIDTPRSPFDNRDIPAAIQTLMQC